MRRHHMPAEHLAVPAAFEADDIIAPNRLSHWLSRLSRSLGFRSQFPESGEHLVHRQDQGGHLVGRDLITPQVCPNGSHGPLRRRAAQSEAKGNPADSGKDEIDTEE